MATSTYLKNKILDAIHRGVAFSVASLNLSLHTADPGATGASEVVGGSYARKSPTWSAASGGATETTSIATWLAMPACTVGWVGFWDASSGGNYLFSLPLAVARTLANGDKFELAAGDLDVSGPA